MPRTLPIARLTVDRPQRMTPKGRCDIASWLHKDADYIESQGDAFDLRKWTSGWWYSPDQGISYVRAGNIMIRAAGALSDETRARIAKWLRSRANRLASGRGVFKGRWFTQEFSL